MATVIKLKLDDVLKAVEVVNAKSEDDIKVCVHIDLGCNLIDSEYFLNLWNSQKHASFQCLNLSLSQHLPYLVKQSLRDAMISGLASLARVLKDEHNCAVQLVVIAGNPQLSEKVLPLKPRADSTSPA